MGVARKHSNDRLQGTLDLLVLKTLASPGPMHGYGITQHIERLSNETLRLEEGSLYPALHRLHHAGARQSGCARMNTHATRTCWSGSRPSVRTCGTPCAICDTAQWSRESSSRRWRLRWVRARPCSAS